MNKGIDSYSGTINLWYSGLFKVLFSGGWSNVETTTLGGVANNIIEGFHNLVFGKSPSGMKKGGIDSRLAYYGDSMVGLMSKEMYLFYSGPRKNSLNKEQKGIIPFNVFQENSDDNLSQVVSAKSNSTVLNLKLTDIAEMGV